MEVDFKFKIEINLESFAAVAIATTLWDHPEIKEKIQDRFENANMLDRDFHPKECGWRKIVKKVSQNVDSLQLPDKVLKKVKGIIEPIGDKIFYWNIYLFANLELEYEYAEKIYWTPYGSIDESKIFQLHWFELDEVKEFALNHVFFYSTLFAQEEFISENIIMMMAHTIEAIKPVKMNLKSLSPYVVMVIWMCIFTAKDIEKGLELYKELKKSKRIAFEICKNCIESGTHLSAKYFWNKLKEREKDAICRFGIENFGYRFNNKGVYQEEGCVLIMLYVLNDLSAEKRNKYILENFVSVFKYIMNVWPYQKLMVELVDAYIDHLTSDQLEFLYNYTLTSLAGDFEGKRYINSEVNEQILCQVLQKIPTEKKLSQRFLPDKFLRKLIDYSDLSVLGTILNDKDFLFRKEKLLQMALPKLQFLITLNDLELVTAFVENVLPSKDNQKILKLKLNVAQDLINSGDIKLAETLLSWIADNNEEKIRLKREIDPLKFCIDSKNFSYEKLKEFLSWQCEGEEEKTKLKDIMKNIEFVADKIIKIWNQSKEEGECQCFEFLKQLTGSDEEASKLKNSSIIDEKLLLTYCDTLPSLNSFDRIDALLSFFSATPEQVLKIKKEIIENIDKWAYRYIVTQKNYKMAETIVNYVFNDEDEKKAALVNYINSNSGARLIFKAYMNYKRGHSKGILFLLNGWVKLYGNVKTIKDNVSLIEPENENEYSGKVALDSVLDEVEGGFGIDLYDLHVPLINFMI